MAFRSTSILIAALGSALTLSAQAPAEESQSRQLQGREPSAGEARAGDPSQQFQKYSIPLRTRVPLVLVNSVSTKTSEVGDQVYLQTSFPVFGGNRIVIPEGSYVTGTITQVKRPGRIKGRGEIYIRFDTLALRNGIQRDFRGTVSATDGGQSSVAEKEGKIVSEGTKGDDAAAVAGTVIQGASTGSIIGAVNGNAGQGAAIGAAAGATAGMIGVLLQRGSEVQLLRGTSMEMVLDRELVFYSDELDFSGSAPSMPLPYPPAYGGTINADPNRQRGTTFPLPGTDLPWPY